MNRITKSGKSLYAEREGKLQVLSKIGYRHLQTSGVAGKNKKRVLQKNKNTSQNPALKQTSH